MLKALILVGGYGTRLRPLTFTVPKPLVEFANLPILLHQIEACVKVGVKRIILAVNVEPEQMLAFLKKVEAQYSIEIICSREETPMGTAGPLALAKKYLTEDEAPFFMFNSDVICEFPLAEMLSFHRGHGGEGTIFTTLVKDPSKYGVIVSEEATGKIQTFVEKPPPPFPSHAINAGIYLLNSSVCHRVPMKPTSIEREIFPVMAGEGVLYSRPLKGYWMDIGQPKDFLSGQVLHLEYLQTTNNTDLAPVGAPHIKGNVLIHKEAKVDPTAELGPDVVIGPGCIIGPGARIKRSCILAGSKIAKSAFVNSSIIGWQSTVGAHSYVNECFLGEDVQINAEIAVNQIIVCPHKGISESIFTEKIIM